MFEITCGKGFRMTFANGWTVSVQFGRHNYCDTPKGSEGDLSCETAEIAAWNMRHATGEPYDHSHWHDFGSDTVKGYCQADEVAAFITMIAAK